MFTVNCLECFYYQKKYCLRDLFHMMKEQNQRSMVSRSVVIAGEDSELKVYLLSRKGFFKKKKEEL